MVRVEGIDDAERLRRSIARLARRLNAKASDEGLTPTEASVLGAIAVHGPLGIGDLVEREQIHPTMLSRLVTRLDEADLVERRPSPKDSRAAILEVTPQGRQLHERLKLRRANLVLQAVSRLPDADQTALREALGALEALADLVV